MLRSLCFFSSHPSFFLSHISNKLSSSYIYAIYYNCRTMYFKDFVFLFVMHIEMIQIKRSFIVVWKILIDPSHMEYSQVVEIDITV